MEKILSPCDGGGILSHRGCDGVGLPLSLCVCTHVCLFLAPAHTSLLLIQVLNLTQPLNFPLLLTAAPNKCELNCIPKGESFYYKHKEAVVDGSEEAEAIFEAQGQRYKAELRRSLGRYFCRVYYLDGQTDSFHGPMVPSTGYLQVFGLMPFHIPLSLIWVALASRVLKQSFCSQPEIEVRPWQ